VSEPGPHETAIAFRVILYDDPLSDSVAYVRDGETFLAPVGYPVGGDRKTSLIEQGSQQGDVNFAHGNDWGVRQIALTP